MLRGEENIPVGAKRQLHSGALIFPVTRQEMKAVQERKELKKELEEVKKLKEELQNLIKEAK